MLQYSATRNIEKLSWNPCCIIRCKLHGKERRGPGPGRRGRDRPLWPEVVKFSGNHCHPPPWPKEIPMVNPLSEKGLRQALLTRIWREASQAVVQIAVYDEREAPDCGALNSP